MDDDGIDERIRVCTIGDGLHVLNIEAWDDLPIVMFCPDPETTYSDWFHVPADYLKTDSSSEVSDYARTR